MYTRVLTYDLNTTSTEDYTDLYKLLVDYNAKMITESTYYIKTIDDYDTFKNKVLKATHSKDSVYAIVIVENTMEYRKIR